MIPRWSLFGVLTRRGRFRNRWASTLAAGDVDALRELWPQFMESVALTDYWVPFLTSILNGYELDRNDLSALEDVGLVVAGRSIPRPGLREALAPLVEERFTRNEPQAACGLLIRMYEHKLATAVDKSDIAGDLAEHGAIGDRSLQIYTRHLADSRLRDRAPKMRRLIAKCLVVGFDVSEVRIRRAGRLANALDGTFPGVELALGFHALRNTGHYADAVAHLERAWSADPKSEVALTGLLAAWIRNGDHDLVARQAKKQFWIASETADRLHLLGTTLNWLEDSDVTGSVPATAAELAHDLEPLVGPWYAYAVGRLHLLEGNAKQAATLLIPVVGHQPHWAYHAAWACLLTGDRARVSRLFDEATGWPGRWTIGCLLMECDPSTVDSLVAPLSTTPKPYAAVVAVRMALARHSRPPELDWQPGSALEEGTETVRTAWGLRFIAHRTVEIAAGWERGVARRLPLAERLLWEGLGSLSTGRGRVLLERAAYTLGHPRAALVLAVHDMEQDRYDEADRLLDRFSWRADPTMRVLRAWVQARGGDERGTVVLEQLAAKGSTRACRALGSLYLGQAAAARSDHAAVFARQAAADFKAGGLLVFAHATELLDVGASDDARHWPEVSTWQGPEWLRWVVALAELTQLDPAVSAGEHLVTVITDDPFCPLDVRQVVAAALVRSCLTSTDAERAAAFADLARQLGGSEIAQAHVARLSPEKQPGSHPAARMVAAERSLREGDPATAVRHLRALPESGETWLGTLVADLLDGSPLETIEDVAGLPEKTELALRIVRAAAVAERDPRQCAELLVPVVNATLHDVIDLRPCLPLLCAMARDAEAVRALVVEFAAEGGDPFVLGHCAVAVGELEIADELWQRAHVFEEHVRLLCHLAVQARGNGDDLSAAGHLRLASRVQDQLRLIPGMDEVAELRERCPQRDLPRFERSQSLLTEAGERGDTRGALTMLALLRHLVGDDEPNEFDTRAQALELRGGTDRLLRHLFPARQVREWPGRHRVLEDVIKGSPALFVALRDDDPEKARRIWMDVLGGRDDDLRLHHAVAALYRERALVEIAADGASGELLAFATTLWAMLTGTTEFWAGFGDRVTGHEDTLLEEVMRELFGLHAAIGASELAAGRKKAAEPHVRTLVTCTKGDARIQAALGKFGVSYRHKISPARLSQVSAIAGEVLQGWCADVVWGAEKAVNDVDTIAELPEGMARNYPAGIKHLERFARLGVPVVLLLRTGLEWYHEWCFSLHIRGETEELKQRVKAAKVFADQLVPLCTKGHGHRPENQVLSRYFMMRGVTAASTGTAEREFAESIEWNPENRNTRELARTLEGQQSSEVNVEAVRLVETVTKILDDFERAAKRQISLATGSGFGTDPVGGWLIGRHNCGACGDRSRVWIELASRLAESGQVEFSSASAFWREFRQFLCNGCQRRLDSLEPTLEKARSLLLRALELDPGNHVALENLTAVDEMRRVL